MQQKIEAFLWGCRRRYRAARDFVQRYWKRGVAIAVIIFIVINKDIDIDLSLDGAENSYAQPTQSTAPWLDLGAAKKAVTGFLGGIFERDEQAYAYTPGQYSAPVNTSLLEKESPSTRRLTSSGNNDRNLANTFSNMTFSIGDFATDENSRARAEKKRKQLKYVKAYAEIARREMREYGIPASITLAQGLLESNAGESSLANRNNNHFGIKCFSKSCGKGHCSNFTDDHHKDFFRIYKSPEESYRAHSRLLGAKRYRNLFDLSQTDYISWAKGLKKAGYATDKHYAEKLINLIEELDLHRYDF